MRPPKQIEATAANSISNGAMAPLGSEGEEIAAEIASEAEDEIEARPEKEAKMATSRGAKKELRIERPCPRSPRRPILERPFIFSILYRAARAARP